MVYGKLCFILNQDLWVHLKDYIFVMSRLGGSVSAGRTLLWALLTLLAGAQVGRRQGDKVK